MKTLNLIIASLLLLASVSVTADNSNKLIGSGTITFTGSIVDAPCGINIDLNGNSGSCYNQNTGKMETHNIEFKGNSTLTILSDKATVEKIEINKNTQIYKVNVY